MSKDQEYAICEMFGDGFMGRIMLAQNPGKPTVAKTSLKGLGPKKTYRLDFHENGEIGN